MGPATNEALIGRTGEHIAAAADEGGRGLVRQSFRQIFDEHAAAVGRTLRYLGVPESDLRDAAQDVFVVVDRRYVEFEAARASGRGYVKFA